jgi:hypothetical protein
MAQTVIWDNSNEKPLGFSFFIETPPPYVAFVLFRNPMELTQECATA